MEFSMILLNLVLKQLRKKKKSVKFTELREFFE